MANTVQTQISIRVTGDTPMTLGPTGPTSIALAGNLSSSVTMSIPTAGHTLLPPSQLATPGVCYFSNLDTTNFVQIGVDVGAVFVPFGKLGPASANGPTPLSQGEFPLDGTNALYAKSDTAACRVQINVLQR